MTTRLDTIDDALARLADHRYVDGAGFACHGPMAAEALSALGFDDRVAALVDRYVATHPPIDAPPATEPIDPDDDRSWRPALGDFARVTDWTLMFERQLREQPWQAVLARWIPRFVSGYGGGLTHGLLRTAHAVRAVPPGGDPSPLLTGELAKGLGSWAAWYRALPGEPHLRGPLPLDEALARVPRPRGQWSPLEAGTFARFGELVTFPDAIEALGAPDDPAQALSELSAACCRVMLTHPDAAATGLVHSITPIAAVRTLIERVPTISTESVYPRLWQVGAAIVAAFAGPGGAPAASVPSTPGPDPTALAARAADDPDPHVVKFTEACLREHALRPDPVYLHAAEHVIQRLAT